MENFPWETLQHKIILYSLNWIIGVLHNNWIKIFLIATSNDQEPGNYFFFKPHFSWNAENDALWNDYSLKISTITIKNCCLLTWDWVWLGIQVGKKSQNFAFIGVASISTWAQTMWCLQHIPLGWSSLAAGVLCTTHSIWGAQIIRGYCNLL